MKTKPFDLEKALAGHPVVTRDGIEVTQLHLFHVDRAHSLAGVILGTIFFFTKQGNVRNCGIDDEYDLFMKVETKKKWYNLYRGVDGTLYSSMAYDSKDKASQGVVVDRFYVTTIEIEEEI